MRTHIFFCIAISVLTGCGTTTKTLDGRSVSPPTPEEIYQTKIAFCENVVSYEQVTQFVGNERTLSPGQRKSVKDKVWDKWISDIAKTKENLSSKVYTVEIPTMFGDYDEQRQRMRQKDSTHRHRIYSGSHYGATPDKILYNSTSNEFHTFLATIPQGAPLRWVWDYYGNTDHSLPDTYVINTVIKRFKQTHTAIGAKYGGGFGNRNLTWQLGIFIDDASQWILSQQSPIFKEDGKVYLNLKRFDFVDVFGVYPDTGNVSVRISYLFEIIGCSGKIPQGVVKEVIIKTIHQINGSETEIARVII